MKEIIFIGAAVFCFLHSYRDYLHSKKIFSNWFTTFGHLWDAPQYEKHGMVLFGCLGVVFTLMAF